MKQLSLTFNTRQNTPDNQRIYDANKKGFSRQCQLIYDLLMTGRTVTVREMMNLLDIGDPRARIRDLRDAGVQVLDKEISNGNGKYKSYYIQL